MAHVNGALQNETPRSPLTAMAADTQPNPHGVQFTPERLREIKAKLEDPFDPGEIKWRVTATSRQQTKRGVEWRGQVVAYADQRAYTDRLNEVFGEWGWTRTYGVQVAQNFERCAGSGENKQTAVSAKVVVVSTVTIHGLGSHTGVGEEWADDENAATRAEAQAFKRACACVGLGRYLYDFDKEWVDLDEYKRPVRTPSLPEWALPAYVREQQASQRSPKTGSTHQRNGLVREELLGQVQALCDKVGHSLSLFVLTRYGGTPDVAKLDFTKLTIVYEKLADIGRGVERLRKAASVIGDGRYSIICRELNFASESIDDIPNRDALRVLLTRVEEEAAGSNSGTGTQATIGELRGRLLQAARKAEEDTRNGWPTKLADVIKQASGGKITLERLKDLGTADAPDLQAAIARLTEKEAG